MTFDLSDYVDVRARIQMFKDKYPTGTLQPANLNEPFKVVQIGDKSFIAYTACAYRTPDDPRPGVGVAWEPVPGRTPYTKDSELMNAETSSWGRAIIAVLAVDRLNQIASAEEVRNRQTPQVDGDIVQMPTRTTTPQPAAKPKQFDKPASSYAGNSGEAPRMASPKQHAFMRSLATRLELGDAELTRVAGCDIEEMTIAQAKRTIDNLIAVQKGEAHLVFGDDGSVSIISDGPAT
jgi:hypothetical protein